MSLSESYSVITQKESRSIRAKILKDSREICRIAKKSQSEAIKALETRGVFIDHDKKTGKKIVSVGERMSTH